MVIKDAKRCDMHHILGHLPTTKDIPLDHMTISLDHLSAIYCHPEMPLTISRAALGHLLDHPPNTTEYLLHHRFLGLKSSLLYLYSQRSVARMLRLARMPNAWVQMRVRRAASPRTQRTLPATRSNLSFISTCPLCAGIKL